MYSKEKKYETILAIILGLLVIYWFTEIRWLVTVCLALATIGVLWSTGAGWITYIWLKLSHVLGWVMSKVILGLVFYVILVPIALLSRIFNKDSLKLKKNKTGGYYTDRNHEYCAEDLENPW
jgi:predicted membrane protein